jgi:F-type H+-transporting ATPase subunit delta
LPAEKAIVSGLSGRYATALFALARESASLEALARDRAHLTAFFGEQPGLLSLAASPLLTRNQQGAVVETLATRLDLSALMKKFLGVLTRNRRLSILLAVLRDLSALEADHKGEVTADVRVARALTKTQMTALEAQLKSIAGRDVAINASVDESLIGGLVVRIGSRMIDSSIATKLDSLERAMKGI